MRTGSRAALYRGMLVVRFCWLSLTSPGCSLITSPELTYRSNEDLVESIATAIDFQVSSKLFKLRHVQVQDDVIGLEYLGVAFPGDSAWVWRYSPKSSEQEPDSLVDPRRFLPVLREKRSGLEPGPTREEALEGSTLRYVEYSFESPIHDSGGRALAARGIVGTLEREMDGEPIIYSFNLDNWGDRASLGRKDLKPFVRQMLR